MDDNSQTADEVSILLDRQSATNAAEATNVIGEYARAAVNMISVVLEFTYPPLRA